MNYGSDIGGYLGDSRTKELFLRWTQLGAFSPLMENGGNGEHRYIVLSLSSGSLSLSLSLVGVLQLRICGTLLQTLEIR